MHIPNRLRNNIRHALYAASNKYHLQFAVIIVIGDQSPEAIIHQGQWSYYVTADCYNHTSVAPIILQIIDSELSHNSLNALFELAAAEYWKRIDRH